MGLDIYFCAKNMDRFVEAERRNKEVSENRGLSRWFCYIFLSEYAPENPKSRISVLGKIAKVDVLPLIKMTWYCDESEMEGELIIYDDEDEKQEFITKTEKTNLEVIGNINSAYKAVKDLILGLSEAKDLLDKIETIEKGNVITSEEGSYYFSDFDKDKGEVCPANNLGQDLRNLKKQIELAMSIGEDTVYLRFF